MRIFVIISVLMFSVFASLPAHAVSKKELHAMIIVLEQRLAALEKRMLTGDPAAERLMQRMDALESSNRSLTGEVERLRYERDNLQDEVRALAKQISDMQKISEDMKRHLKAVDVVANRKKANSSTNIYGGGRSGGAIYQGGSSIPAPPRIIETNPAPSQPETTDIGKLAKLGQDKLRMGDFGGAQTAFKQYIEFNPDAHDIGDVYFWLGESYYARSAYSDAADAYIKSMRKAPKGQYAPEAMVKLAATARALGKKDMACQTLRSFSSQYPSASSSVRTKVQLEKQRSGC